jgi:outer membrane protein
MKLTYRVSVLGMVLLAGVTLAAAQTGTGGTTATAPSSRVGVIDIRQAIAATAEGKLAAAELQSQFAPKQADLANMRKSVEELQARLSSGGNTMSDEERGRLERQGERLARSLQRKQEEYQEEANGAQSEIFDRLGRKMVEVIARYARENNYGVILDASQACGVFCSNHLDVTQDIIRLYDQANPVKASTTAPTGTQRQGTQPPKPVTPQPVPPKPKP